MTRSSMGGCSAWSFATAAARSPPHDSWPSVTRTIKRFPLALVKSEAAARSDVTIGVAPRALTASTLRWRPALSTPESGTNRRVSSQAPAARASTVEP